MDWQPILAIGSLITAFFTAWRWGINPLLKRRRQKLLEKKNELRLKIQNYVACRNSIDYSIKNRVLTNELDQYYADVSTQGISQEFSVQAKEYIKNYGKLQDWLKASKIAVKYEIEMHVKSDLPITKKKYDLDLVLEDDRFIPIFIEGQRINKRWIEETHPKIWKDYIIKHLEEPETETELDVFFVNLNRALENNDILKRFRKEKKDLIEFGTKLMEDLDCEIQRLQGELG